MNLLYLYFCRRNDSGKSFYWNYSVSTKQISINAATKL